METLRSESEIMGKFRCETQGEEGERVIHLRIEARAQVEVQAQAQTQTRSHLQEQ